MRNNTFDRAPRIGEIYMIRFSGSGSEQAGWRPGLVYQNNTGNLYSPNIIALPLTTAMKKLDMPTHVVVPASVGLKKDSMVLCENPERISKERLGKYITTLPDVYMSEIAEASLLATSAISYINPDTLLTLWQRAVSLNEGSKCVA